jgi:hypothetical protein
MNLIIDQWTQGRVPIFNGVIESSGRVHSVHPVDPPRRLPMKLRVSTPGELPEVEWTTALPFEKVRDVESQMVAIVGECGMGSDGFVALQATENSESLIWLAFFDFSNPFESVRLEGGVIKARNNIGEEWHFTQSSKWKVEIHSAT